MPVNEYRKKPVVIQAIQFIGHNDAECLAFCPTAVDPKEIGPSLIIPTLKGDHRCSVGDYIIRGVKGEFYPCKPDIFEATYSLNFPRKENLDFGQALEALKDGCKIARAGWNGKGMWLMLLHKDGRIWDGEHSFPVRSSIGIKTAQGDFQPGWHASQQDMLAEDWYVLD